MTDSFSASLRELCENVRALEATHGGDRMVELRRAVLKQLRPLLGNVEIGKGARIGAGSVVLKDVPPHTSVAGVPAKELGKVQEASPALGMDHMLDPTDVDGGEAI